MPGYSEMAVPVSDGPALFLAGSAGYGFTESMGPVEGTHHNLFGRIGFGGVIVPQFAVGLDFIGKIDIHPDDDQGADKSILGDTRLTLRGGAELGSAFQLGAQAKIWVPGGVGSSIEWSSTSLDMSLLAAIAPRGKRFSIGFTGGFRLDNSANAAPDMNRIRPGDRVSLELSDFHAILAGIGFSYGFTRLELVAEVTGDFLIGDGAPTGRSPIRAHAGIRYALVKQLALEIMTRTFLNKRPSVKPEDALVPIEPRFAVTLGLTWGWSFKKDSGLKEDTAEVAEVAPVVPVAKEKPGVVRTTFSGVIVDNEGLPIQDAVVTINAGGEVIEVVTDENGIYTADNVPVGPADLKVTATYYEDMEWSQTVTKGMPPLKPKQLVAHVVGSQLRGLVRSFEGEGLEATISVQPGGQSTQTEDNGQFRLDLEPGSYKVVIEAKGYKTQKRKIKVTENSVSILNVDLRKKKKK